MAHGESKVAIGVVMNVGPPAGAGEAWFELVAELPQAAKTSKAAGRMRIFIVTLPFCSYEPATG
jgi:hypothetical protein